MEKSLKLRIDYKGLNKGLGKNPAMPPPKKKRRAFSPMESLLLGSTLGNKSTGHGLRKCGGHGFHGAHGGEKVGGVGWMWLVSWLGKYRRWTFGAPTKCCDVVFFWCVTKKWRWRCYVLNAMEFVFVFVFYQNMVTVVIYARNSSHLKDTISILGVSAPSGLPTMFIWQPRMSGCNFAEIGKNTLLAWRKFRHVFSPWSGFF